MSGNIIWTVGDKVMVTGEQGDGVVTEVIPMIFGFNMYNVSINGRIVRMVADKPALPRDNSTNTESTLTDPPKPKFKNGQRVVVKSLKGTKSNEGTITLVGAAVPDKNGKWSITYLVQLEHNGAKVEYTENDLAGF